jgi:AraC-like DNA-binding protein
MPAILFAAPRAGDCGAGRRRLPDRGAAAPEAGSLVDPIVHALGQSLAPSLACPEYANPLFVDHVSFALTSHLCQAYGAINLKAESKRPRLAPWQERLAKEAIMARLDGALTLNELATICGLSLSHFARAFANTVGMPPYRWLLERRLERARELLFDSDISLIDISLACGFANQSHLTKTFTRHVGVSPASGVGAVAAEDGLGRGRSAPSPTRRYEKRRIGKPATEM